jgi:hypothetical protein
MRAEYSPAAQPGVVTLRMDACGFFVERRFGIELNINPVEMALVEFPPLDGTRPTAQITRTLEAVRSLPEAAFDGAEERDCSLEIPGDMVIAMDGLRFLRAWCLPHFYFHVVTAYDILRHNGVELGKRDYLSQVGAFIRPKK